MMAEVIAVDFDGVLCDGLDECLLVAWLAFADRAESGDLIFRIGFSIALLDTIPASFKDHFAHCRNFVRHSGHFIIPFLFPAPFETQAEFDAAYKTVEKGRLEAFLQRFEACRRRLRQERPEERLALHTLYPGIPSALTAARLPLFIVTAKDTPSVLAILKGAGVNFQEDRIYGGATAKLGAFHDIMRQSGCGPERIAFYDDNVLNVAEARGAGFDAVWATWGYSSPEHQRIAASQSLPSITLDEFVVRLGSIPPPKT
jgi:phosphoglycolate phosphatase-like HAD superfamily hydrolase